MVIGAGTVTACRPEPGGPGSPELHVFSTDGRPRKPGQGPTCDCGAFSLTFEGLSGPAFRGVLVLE